MESLPDNVLTATLGLLGGLLLGLAARRGRFCTLGAIEDAVYAKDLRRVRMWALALSVAIAGVFALAGNGLVDVTSSIYATQRWNPLTNILGGLLFGYGMALAGNCGFGALARFGGGDLRSFVIVIVMGIAAYMTISGPIGALRVAVFPPEPASGDIAHLGYAHGIGDALGIDPIGPAIVIATALAVWALASPAFRKSRSHVIWSTVVGVVIASGWWGTTWVAETGFDGLQVQSHSFTAPVGESVLYLMTSTGGGMSFGIGSVAGVLLGALLGSISKGHFRWEACDDPRELGRQVFGAFLMGVGGVLALGCSIGQGLTAFSVLSYSAPVTLAAIVVGSVLGLRQLIHGFSPAA